MKAMTMFKTKNFVIFAALAVLDLACSGAACSGLAGCSNDTFVGGDGGMDPPDSEVSEGGSDADAGDVVVSDGGTADGDLDAFGGSDVDADASPTTKRVFITSKHYASNFGSLAVADTACNTAAATAGLGGAWKAWLSTSTTSASSRLTHFTGSYVLVDGTVVASNWNALVSGAPLKNSIYLDETGTFVPDNFAQGDGVTWTGTEPDGGISTAATCGDWTVSEFCQTTTDYSGACGFDDQTTFQWTSGGSPGCCTIQNFSFYCFEQ